METKETKTKNEKNETKLNPRSISERKHSVDLGKVQRTDQSYKNMVDINCIMERYKKTGQLPHFKPVDLKFMDVTDTRTFEEQFDIVNEARSLFSSLPAEIRNQMNNDPRNLESFINDEKNHDVLLKHGLLERKAKVESQVNVADISKTSDDEVVKTKIEQK